jgi:hypothetical protein
MRIFIAFTEGAVELVSLAAFLTMITAGFDRDGRRAVYFR